MQTRVLLDVDSVRREAETESGTPISLDIFRRWQRKDPEASKLGARVHGRTYFSPAEAKKLVSLFRAARGI